MKIKSAIFALALLITGIATAPAIATENPKIESFTFTPTEIDLIDINTQLDFELIVSHPFGIESTSSFVTIRDARGNSWGTNIYRTDFPVNSALSRVVFKGSIVLPRTILSGVYYLSAREVKNNSTAGYSYGSGAIAPNKIRNLIDAENSLLVKNNGDLNYEYATFQGPSYDGTLSITYKNPTKYNLNNPPIWRVGESFNPSDYFELRVNTLPLVIKTSTPRVCASTGKILTLISEGSCNFTVYTNKTTEFALYEKQQIIQISNPRIKPTLLLPKIENQNSSGLPKSIDLLQVYSSVEGYILPKSITPTICYPIGFTLRIVSGGICTLTYQTAATSTYLASDVYQQTFEIVRGPQTITFTPPATANLASRTVALSATASSGGAVTYATTSTGICSITGSTLNLLMRGNCAITATQAGTTTLAPISATATVMIAGAAAPSRKTITCVKGNKSKKVSGTNPKCPTGYKLKR
jgi:hypothetical protein